MAYGAFPKEILSSATKDQVTLSSLWSFFKMKHLGIATELNLHPTIFLMQAEVDIKGALRASLFCWNKPAACNLLEFPVDKWGGWECVGLTVGMWRACISATE